MNKMKYTKPEMEIVVFESEDVITASAPETPDIEFKALGIDASGLWD